MGIYSKHFSHIYVEHKATDYAFCSHFLDKYSNSEIIYIDSYRDVFFRSNQSFDMQKRSKSWILAVKTNNFIYDGSHFAQDAGYQNFFYNTLSHNCLYDCSYCYLQGMNPSANIVSFVNIEDYFKATRTAISHRKVLDHPLFLSLSYDTDLLAMENSIPYCSSWIQFAYDNPDFLGEIRTKSSNFKSIDNLAPTKRILLSWTLSPKKIVDLHEHDTPSFQNRLSSINQAVEKGWLVRLCFDPVLTIDGWKALYEDCVSKVFDTLPCTQIMDATVGTFRMSSDYLRLARKRRPQFGLLQQDWEVRDSVVSENPSKIEEVNTFMVELLSNWLPRNKISCWI